jgi:hypothetical protein
MAIVGVVALNFGAARLLINYDGDLLIAVALSAIVVQIGAFLFFKSRGQSRAFWGGFVVLAVAAATSCCYGLFIDEESAIGTAWNGYLDHIDTAVVRSGFTLRPNPTGTYFAELQAAVLALIMFVAQLAVALSGGLVTLLLCWLTQLFLRRPPAQPVPA